MLLKLESLALIWGKIGFESYDLSAAPNNFALKFLVA